MVLGSMWTRAWRVGRCSQYDEMSKSEMQLTDCTSKFVIFETQHIFDPHASLNMERVIPPPTGKGKSHHHTEHRISC